MSFWDGTLWSMVRAAPSGDGYCLLVSAGTAPGEPVAWWAKESGASKGSIVSAAECAVVAPS